MGTGLKSHYLPAQFTACSISQYGETLEGLDKRVESLLGNMDIATPQRIYRRENGNIRDIFKTMA